MRITLYSVPDATFTGGDVRVAWVLLNGHAHGARHTFEHRFIGMMRLLSEHLVDMQIHARLHNKCLEEIIEESQFEIQQLTFFTHHIFYEIRPPA